MKTQQELMQAYWGPGGTVDMVKEYNAKHGTNIHPWECVRMTYNGSRTQQGRDHPYFDCDKAIYTFALTILYDDKRKVHRPVFADHKLYYKEDGSLITIGNGGIITNPHNWSWNPPTSKRTFKLNDMELPCPLKVESDADNRHCFDTLYRDGLEFYFDSDEDKKQWSKTFTKLLTAARDKE